MLLTDYVGALMELAKRAKAQPTRLGYLDNFGMPILILADPSHVRTVIDKITAHALWGGLVQASEAFFGKSVLFVLEGEEWKRLRGIIRDAFKLQKMALMQADVTKCAVELSNRLQDFADAGEAVDMNAACAMFHLACIGRTTFDFDLDVLQRFPDSNEISDAFEYLLAELPRRAFHPDAKVREDYVSLDNEDNVKWQAAAGSVRKVVVRAIERRLREEAQGEKKRGDLLDAMLDSYRAQGKSTSGESLNIAHLTASIGDNLVEMFFAGYNTSTVAMSVALYYIARDPELASSVRREVDDVIPEDIPAGQGLNPKSFPLLTRVFNEALRMVPPAPLVARHITEDLDLGGTRIPKGTNAWFPVNFLHYDTDSWGPDVGVFRPDRFLKPIKPGSFLPFSGGARSCIGNNFAELESVTVLAVLLKTFEFDVAEGFKFAPVFTGFGFRPFDLATNKVSMMLLPRKRTDTSSFMYEWTPSKVKGLKFDEESALMDE